MFSDGAGPAIAGGLDGAAATGVKGGRGGASTDRKEEG